MDAHSIPRLKSHRQLKTAPKLPPPGDRQHLPEARLKRIARRLIDLDNGPEARR